MPGDGVDFIGTALARLGQFFGGRQQLLGIGVGILKRTSNTSLTSELLTTTKTSQPE